MSTYSVSTDTSRLDVDLIHRWLSQESYWAAGRSREVVERSIRHSLSFGAFLGGEQVGFARVVTDFSTFAWLCDVFVSPAHRGRGVGKRLVQAVTEHPELERVQLMLLATRDAHALYEEYGAFGPIETPRNWMIRRTPTGMAR